MRNIPLLFTYNGISISRHAYGLVKLAVSSGAVSSVLLYCCTAPLLAVGSEQWTAVLLTVISSEQWTAVLLAVVSSEQWTAVLLAAVSSEQCTAGSGQQ